MIDEMMKDPPNPFLLINFDEIGFGKGPQKGDFFFFLLTFLSPSEI